MAVHIQNLCIELLTSKWYSPILHYRDHFWSKISELYIELFVILWFCPPPKWQVYTILALPHDWRKTSPNGLTPAEVLRFLKKKHLPSNLLLNDNDWPFMSCGWAVQVPTSLANYQPTHLPCQTLLICEFSSNVNHQHALAANWLMQGA